ncbi:MAG: flippase-like domain-containing protein [Acidobacteria bacterium]|nr:flippase-like domain-containing protein [Acidobacteriota bacterium]
MKLRSRFLALTSAIIGIALFIYVIKETGPAEIWAHVRSLGFGFLLILAISSIRYLSRSFSWLRCMTTEERRIGFWTLWRARLAGEAIGDLTFGPLVAEPMKVVALGDKLTLSSGISSLAVENIAYAVSSCLMVMAGAIALLASFGLNESLRTAVLGSLAVVLVLSTATFVVIGRRMNLGSNIAAILSQSVIREGPKRGWVDEKIGHLRRLEDYVFDFYARRPLDFLLVGLCQAAFHIAGVVEIYATLSLIGVDLTIATSFMLEAINRAINIAFIFVPALVGVDEAGTGLMTSTLGYGATVGVALAIIRKIRMFFWIGIGLFFLSAARKGE